MDRRRDAIIQPGVAQKPNVGLAHFLTVATKKMNIEKIEILAIDRIEEMAYR